MKPYLLSLALGLLVGAIYALSGVRSPAPPVIALVGLLGILAGEQIPSLVKTLMQRGGHAQLSEPWLERQVKPHMFGQLPTCAEPVTTAEKPSSAPKETDHG